MAPSKAILKKLYNEEIVSLALDYYHKFDSKLASIKNELSDLQKTLSNLALICLQLGKLIRC